MSEDLRDEKAAEERVAAEPSERFASRQDEPEVEGHIRASGPERVAQDPSRVSRKA